MKGFTRDDLLLLCLVAVWGFNYAAMKLALRELEPLAFLILRYGIALAVLLVLFTSLEGRWTARRKDLGRLLVIGLVGITINQIVFNVGMKYTSAANASLLLTTSPIFGLVFGWLLLGERVKRRRWLGGMAALLGVALIVAGGQQGLRFGLDSLAGDLLILGSAATWTLYSVIARPVLGVYSPLQLTTYGMLIGFPLLIPVTFPSLLAVPWPAVSSLAWAMTLFTGTAMAITSVLWYRSIVRLGTSRALVFMYLVPFFGVLSAIIILQEALTPLQIGGAVATLVGVNIARQG